MPQWVDRKAIKAILQSAEGEFKVDTTIKLKGGKIGHVGVMTKGMIKAGDDSYSL